MAKKTDTLDKGIKNYVLPIEERMPGRCAHFLDWAAEHYPGQYVPYNMLLKVIQQLPNMPQIRSKDVLLLAKRMHAVKKVLFAVYARRMHSQPGVGVRATTGSADVLQNVLVNDAQRFDSARKSMTNTASLVKLSEVPNTPEFQALKEWMGKGLKETLKLINSDDWLQKALPPAREPKDA